VTRTLKRLAPNCINAVFHACWSSSPQKPQPPMTDERRAAASREVGEFYLEHRNYRAAESRFREALTYNPADSRAMFDLGQSLEKLSRFDDAIEEYRYCADSDPNSAYAPRCRKRLEVVSSRLGSVPKR
jgi:Tfp pilus assembly protein PilF